MPPSTGVQMTRVSNGSLTREHFETLITNRYKSRPRTIAAKKRPAIHSATITCIAASCSASSSHAYPQTREVYYSQKRLSRPPEHFLDRLVQLKHWEYAISTDKVCLSVRYARLFRLPAMHSNLGNRCRVSLCKRPTDGP